MKRRIAMLVVVVMCAGCAAAPDVVDQPDEEEIARLQQYEVEQREVEFYAADALVHGTLTIPRGREDAPGVVLVAGSGPTDRDWNNPLLPGDGGTAQELAERMAQAGVAVLRYDKRGTGHTELPGNIRWGDYLEELEEAVARLETAEEVDPQRLYVAGHSEGGAHALRAVAQQRIEVQGVMLLSVPGRTIRQLVVDEVREDLAAVGMTEQVKQAELRSLQQALDSIARGEEVDARSVSDIPGLVSLVAILQQEDSRQFAAELLNWDPTEAIRRVDVPILVLNGLKDLQVDPERDARRLYEAADQTNEQVELALVEHADHVLKHQSMDRDEIATQPSLTYNDPARVLDEAVLETLVRWVRDDQQQ